MKGIYIIGIVMLCLTVIPFVSAGSIGDDCTSTEKYCTAYETKCDLYYKGSCVHTSKHCTTYADRCTNSIETETDVDADTLNGETAADIVKKVDTHSGIGLTAVWDYMQTDKVTAFFRSLIYKDDKYKLLETWAYTNGFNPESEQLKVSCAERFGTCAGYINVRYD